MFELLVFFVTTGVLPVVINKSTERGRFDWMHPHLRIIWTGIFAFFSLYLLEKDGTLEATMKMHRILDATSPALGYLICAPLGALLLCGYWWFSDKTFPRIDGDSGSKAKRLEQGQLPASFRMKYSSRQVLQMSNVPGEYTRTLNLDNVATLLLFAPFNREAVTLSWPMLPTVTIAEPKADEKYKVPGGTGQVQLPQAGKGLEVRGLTMMGGPVKTIKFELGNPVRFVRVGERIFRVSLESVRDKSSSEHAMFLEYEFAISEEDQNPENLAAAITQDAQKPALPSPPRAARGGADLIAAMDSLPVGTISLRLRESVDEKPNVVQMQAATKLFLFDPTSRTVMFRMKTTGGKSIELRLHFANKPAPDSHFVTFVWDNSKGARLHIDDKVTRDGLDDN